MASRSTLVKLTNTTSLDLTLSSVRLLHGIWTDNFYPPASIPAGKEGIFQAESQGFMTGDEGTVQYSISNLGFIEVYFDNPYAGSNSYRGSAPKGFTLTYSGGSGDNSSVAFTLVAVA